MAEPNDIANKPAAKRKLGNPSWEKGGKSPNPDGRPKVVEEFRSRCRRAVDEKVIAAWIHEVESLGPNWLRASELLAAYGYGRPSQTIDINYVRQLPDEQLRQKLAEVAAEWREQGLVH